MANMHRIEIISSPARIHLPSSRCPAPGTSQPASSASIGGTRLAESSTSPLSPATRGYCTFVAIPNQSCFQMRLSFASSLRGCLIVCGCRIPGFPNRRGRLLRCGFCLLRRSNYGVQSCAFHARHELDDPSLADVQNQPVDDLVPKVAVSHLTALESQGGLDLVAIAKKPDRHILLGLIVVFVDGDRELYFLYDDHFLLLARGALALVFLIQELAVILNAADRRNCIWRDLDQIERALACHLQCIEGRHDSKLLAILVDDANFTGTNSFVGADKRLCGTFINRRDSELPQRACEAAMRMFDWIASLHGRLRTATSITLCARTLIQSRMRQITHLSLLRERHLLLILRIRTLEILDAEVRR